MLQDAVKKLAYEMFHGHKQLSDLQLKERLKEILENNEQCVSFLEKLEEKDLFFDEL